ncbi:hypothetical protein MIND_00340400 [Mycena indigotica]|uniref:Uncharacterized protein n=1 Tax=Mycena indigotica TaxID=2126181 RepID=A0A8H6T2J2_9AGAR|nr:uncharacterized protein MIND_00340400 [Mycena indigotica]KAF7309690.1 hypothetical protein MIND_00340400 [Mycena indigotica]
MPRPSAPPQTPRNDDQRLPLNSRIISSVRRTLSTAKRREPLPTPMTERTSRFRYDSVAPPTVEQIAMGLHLSRTPHLRSSKDTPTVVRYPPPPASHPQPTIKPISPAQPPLRSSMKKPAGYGAPSSSSTTDVTSTAPSTPHSSERSSASLRAKMARLFPYRGPQPSYSTPSSSAVSSPRTSTSELQHPRKKAVRFSNPVEEEE